ncbi:hypothetical protein [Helicobacter himalayensis]|uniref:hypothetical protein n=1 Tax=Helicobacter himalayensis TaxID=1591088 RepID=UPI000834EE58|nr:hypothetical protein [Helicobacter himalayensis]
MQCSECNGCGIVDCRSCGVSGIIAITTTFECQVETHREEIKIVEGEHPFNPEYIIKLLPQEKLSDYGETSRIDIQYSEDGEYYRIKLPLASFQVLFHSKNFDWKLYESDMRVARCGEIFAYILNEDLESLKCIAEHLYKPFLLIRASKTIKTFIESQVNRAIFEKFRELGISTSQVGI